MWLIRLIVMCTQVDKKKVLVTGFGPFQGHSVNASWESVKELQKGKFTSDVTIHIAEIPVAYKYVEDNLYKLEKELNPDLIMHVGVSSIGHCVQIEEFAHSTGYTKQDVEGCIPDESSIGPKCLKTSLDISELRMFCDKHACSCTIESSTDAGRYLCEYIYYTSLNANIAPALFVHVPCLDAPYSKEELAETLRLIVLAALSQISRTK
ncbi:pyroglutamyl-peptidase 1-like [Rhopilema esculentum]|uniref:pyroglutamyl-peptidase 1-like n=1 Tax=Rhopilema esculentum TaxID=499914 RepID=UPI0031D19B57